jgi:hypothetical protein
MRHKFDVDTCLLCASRCFSLLNIFTYKHVSFNEYMAYSPEIRTGAIISCVSFPLFIQYPPNSLKGYLL